MSGADPSVLDSARPVVEVAEVLAAARLASASTQYWDQQRTDDVVRSVGWELYREENARRLARLSLEATGLGELDDLYALHRKRVFGTLRDVHGARTVGVIAEDPGRGTSTLAKPLGVVAVIAPATAPCTTIATNVLSLLKTRNAVVISAHPSAVAAVRRAVEDVRIGLRRVDADENLVQLLEPSDRERSADLMAGADFVVATGGAGTVHRAYRSGTPAVGAGKGNSTLIVDELADVRAAISSVCHGAGFNHGTSCSSESNLLVAQQVWDAVRSEILAGGGWLCTADDAERLTGALWDERGTLNRDLVGRSPREIARRCGVALPDDRDVRTLVVVRDRYVSGDPAFTEKLAPVLTIAPYRSFDEAVDTVQAILGVSGLGHSCGLHTGSGPVAEERISHLATSVSAARVMVNQSTMGNAGSFDNGLEFTSVVASGSWGGCSQSVNISWRHFLNHTTISRPIAPRMPDPEEIFGAYLGPAQREPVPQPARLNPDADPGTQIASQTN